MADFNGQVIQQGKAAQPQNQEQGKLAGERGRVRGIAENQAETDPRGGKHRDDVMRLGFEILHKTRNASAADQQDQPYQSESKGSYLLKGFLRNDGFGVVADGH